MATSKSGETGEADEMSAENELDLTNSLQHNSSNEV